MQSMDTTRAQPRLEANCLIVEDSAFDSEKMTRVVKKAPGKINIEVATTLRAARKALSRGNPELILLDNNLPDGLGANFALELANDPRLADIPIIMVSDWPSPFMWEKAASAGVVFVLNKSEFDSRYVHAVLQRKRRAKLH
ncbi:MAG: response regulator [Sulfitobacter sp.]